MSKNDDLVRRLQPCPICGGTPSLKVGDTIEIECTHLLGDPDLDEGYSSVEVRSDTTELAVAAWNRRPPAPEESSEGSDSDAGEEWKLVPVQPTEVMALAAYGKQHCRDVYRAMLEAAPSPSPQPPAVKHAFEAEAELIERLMRDEDNLKAELDEEFRLKQQWKARAEAAEARVAQLEAALGDGLKELDRSQRPSFAWQRRARALLSDGEQENG